MNNRCTELCRATGLRLRRCRHRQDHLPGKGVITIRMFQVREEFVPKLNASLGAAGTAHEPQACQQSRRARRLNLLRLPDRPGTAPNTASPADNERGETGQHHEDDKRLFNAHVFANSLPKGEHVVYDARRAPVAVKNYCLLLPPLWASPAS